MLGHNPDNEAGVQYKLTTENRENGSKLNLAVMKEQLKRTK
jgi:hypothetical protein